MHSRGQEEEHLAGDKQAGGGGLMGAAAQFLGGQGERAEEAGVADKPHEPAAGAPMMGMAQRFLGGEEAGAGDKGGAGWGAMAGAAQSFLGHGGEGGVVGGATAEGAGKSDAGLVDKLLGLYAQHQGKQVGRGVGWDGAGHCVADGGQAVGVSRSLCADRWTLQLYTCS